MGDVNCAGCRACCLIEPSLVLHPEAGDDPFLYETVEVDGTTRLKPNGKGVCRYLGANGCSIHGHRPAECRAFDCRELVAGHTAGMNRRDRRRYVAKHPFRDVLRAGLARLSPP